MRVLHVLSHFLPEQIAGTEVYTLALCKELIKKGITSSVVIPNYSKFDCFEYNFEGINVYKYPETSIIDRSLVMSFRAPDGLVYFEEYIENLKPDIIHFHELSGSNGITIHHVLVAKKNGAKVVMTFHLAGYSCKTGTLMYTERDLCDGLIDIHKCSSCYLYGKGNAVLNAFLLPLSTVLYKSGIDSLKWKSKLGTALGTGFIINKLKNNFEILTGNCDKVVVLTKWYEKILLLNGVSGDKINYIPQGLPFESPIIKRVEKLRTGGPVRLMFLGRIDPLKGLHLLIDALMQINPRLIELCIYGQTGELAYENSLRNKTAECFNIKWEGRLQQQKVVITMQQFDALCLCSTFSEMSPLIIQEAFAAGIPVIASNVYGNAEQIVHEVNGLLFQFKSAESLTKQLERLVNEPALLVKLNSNIKSPKGFKEIGNAYNELYESLLLVN